MAKLPSKYHLHNAERNLKFHILNCIHTQVSIFSSYFYLWINILSNAFSNVYPKRGKRDQGLLWDLRTETRDPIHRLDPRTKIWDDGWTWDPRLETPKKGPENQNNHLLWNVGSRKYDPNNSWSNTLELGTE